MVEQETKTAVQKPETAEKKPEASAKKQETNMVAFDFERTPITQIADYIIITASKNNTSDIHFDPREDGMMVRFRIDGDLQDYTYIPKTFERNLTTRLKILANMNITESRLPQDGAIKGDFGGKYLDMRVSCLPLNEGEKIVIRILDYTRSLQGIDSLGFNPENLVKLKRMMGVPNGIILVTGATGSGKSTTVYSILQGLNKPEINIITVEDPIEMNIQGMNQVQVNAEIGMTFAAALRSILRQDPNVILIGEIRDSETAQIAVRASITGHLVLSTIHTNNSLSTIERLLDMDVERYLLSTALTGIISQRLAKQLCMKCRFERETTKYEKKVFKKFMNKDIEKIYDANPNGCKACRKGYKGRIAIQEVLELDEEIRNALNNTKLSKEELSDMVYTNKTITMLQDALGKCIAGLTSFEEVYRVIEIETDPEDGSENESLTKSMGEDVEVENNTTTDKKDEESKEKIPSETKEETKQDSNTSDITEKVEEKIEVPKNSENKVEEKEVKAESEKKPEDKVEPNNNINVINPTDIAKEIAISENKKESTIPIKQEAIENNATVIPAKIDITPKIPTPIEKPVEVKQQLPRQIINIDKPNTNVPVINSDTIAKQVTKQALVQPIVSKDNIVKPQNVVPVTPIQQSVVKPVAPTIQAQQPIVNKPTITPAVPQQVVSTQPIQQNMVKPITPVVQTQQSVINKPTIATTTQQTVSVQQPTINNQATIPKPIPKGN
ncbi:MAG: Flp pilus assembly complex ATPase component TadA [Tenericutes bacterium]|nr:Flp pilus assembly complex ATPase component TadA [Mycoplasmatota bacterium]